MFTRLVGLLALISLLPVIFPAFAHWSATDLRVRVAHLAVVVLVAGGAFAARRRERIKWESERIKREAKQKAELEAMDKQIREETRRLAQKPSRGSAEVLQRQLQAMCTCSRPFGKHDYKCPLYRPPTRQGAR